MSNIVKIEASEYGLDENKARQVSSMFKPMLDKMVELEIEYNELVKTETSQKKCKMAGDLRKQYVKVRTGTSKIHKELKTFYLQGGRFVDGWKNAQLMASSGIENKLKDIENHYINIEKAKIEKLEAERSIELSEFGSEIMPPQLGCMPEDVYNNYLLGVKAAYKLKIEAAKKEEDDRIKAEQQKIEEQKAISEENERLRAERATFEAKAKAEAQKEFDKQLKIQEAKRIEQDKIRAEQLKIQEAKRIEQDKIRAEQLKIQEAKAKSSRNDQQIFNDFKTEILTTLNKEYNFNDIRYSDSINYIKKFIKDYLG